MYKKLLEEFFNEHKITDKMPSAQGITYFKFRSMINPSFENLMQDIVKEHSPERIAEATPTREEIVRITAAPDIIRFMRREVDPLNHSILVEKALEMEIEIMPEVVKRLKQT